MEKTTLPPLGELTKEAFSIHNRRLEDLWRQGLGVSPFVVSVVERLTAKKTAIAARIAQAVKSGVPTFRNIESEELERQQTQHALKALETFLGQVTTGAKLDDSALDFVRWLAVVRAEEGVALTDLLHGYRIANQLVWAAVREECVSVAESHDDGMAAAFLLADFTLGFADLISLALSDVYLTYSRTLLEERIRARRTLMEGLLAGRYTDDDGVIRRYPFVKRLFSKPTWIFSAYGASHNQLQHISTSFIDRLNALGRPSLVVARETDVVGVIAAEGSREDGALPDKRDVEAVCSIAGAGLFVGVGLIAHTVAELPQRYQQARLAGLFVTEDSPVVCIADVPLYDLLFADGKDLHEPLMPEWVVELLAADETSKGQLLETIRTFVDSNMSVKDAATKLGVHMNTVYHRLDRIKVLARGENPREFHGLVQILSALRLVGRLGSTPRLEA